MTQKNDAPGGVPDAQCKFDGLDRLRSGGHVPGRDSRGHLSEAGFFSAALAGAKS